MGDDRVDVRMLRSPIQCLDDRFVRGDQHRRIASAARHHVALDAGAGGAVHSVKHFEHRKAFAVAAVENEIVLRAADQTIEGNDVGSREFATLDRDGNLLTFFRWERD